MGDYCSATIQIKFDVSSTSPITEPKLYEHFEKKYLALGMKQYRTQKYIFIDKSEFIYYREEFICLV